MSSMRNAVQRRNHKERAQPLEREKWGLLEKRKDYKLRAADHKEKQKRLQILKQKATDRNPDEFSFKMMSSKVDSAGRKIKDRGNKILSQDVVKLLKTQDAGYIRTILQQVRKERAQLEEQMVLDERAVRAVRDGGSGKKSKHSVFVDDQEEQKNFKAEEWFGTGGEWAERTWNRPRKEVETRTEDEGEEQSQIKKMSKKKLEAKLQAEKEEKHLLTQREKQKQRKADALERIKAKERDLMIAEEELEIQRAKMANTIGGVNKHGVKFKIRERKR